MLFRKENLEELLNGCRTTHNIRIPYLGEPIQWQTIHFVYDLLKYRKNNRSKYGG